MRHCAKQAIPLFITLAFCFHASFAENYVKVANISQQIQTGDVARVSMIISISLEDNAMAKIDPKNDITWTHGKTKIDVTLDWEAESANLWSDGQPELTFSTKACSDSALTDATNVYPGTAGGIPFRKTLSSDTIHSQEADVGGGQRIQYMWETDLVMAVDLAPCVYLRTKPGPKMQFTLPVEPLYPHLPQTMHAGIESTQATAGQTRYSSESFSHSCNTAVFTYFDGPSGHQTIIANYAKNERWHIQYPNATHPSGRCWSDALPNDRLVTDANGGVASAAKLLEMVNRGASSAKYVPNKGLRVRGVPTDVWEVPGGGGSGPVTLYFSKPEWNFGSDKAPGHRILQRVSIASTGNSSEAAAVYDFVDFRSYVPPWVNFEPCQLLPGGDGCDCLDLNCDHATPDAIADSAVLQSEGLARTSRGGWTNRQRRTLLLVWFFGVAIGALIAVVTAVLLRKLRRGKSSEEPQNIELGPNRVFGSFAPSTGSAGPHIEPQ